MLMFCILANTCLQAACLNWLDRDCRNNPALNTLTIFYIPLVLSVVHLAGALLYLIARSNFGTRRNARVVAAAGTAITLVSFAACLLESCI
jgi:hypothetical protein